MAASQRDNAQIVSVLLDAGAALELTSRDGRTALAIAAQNNSLDCVAVLLAKGARPNGACAPSPQVRPMEELRTPVRALVHRPHCSSLSDADPANPDHAPPATSDPVKPSQSPLEGPTPALTQSFPVSDGASSLLDDCSSSRTSADQCSPVVLAARRGHTAVLELLVRRGADVNPCLDDGRPLLLACIDGLGVTPTSTGAASRVYVRPEVVSVLLALGADPYIGVAGPMSRTPAAELASSPDKGLQRVWAEFLAAGGRASERALQ